jgi:hypothetical protein
MPTSHLQGGLAAFAVVTIAGCSMLIPGPEPLVGGNRWIITVDNQSARPASLLVAVDGAPGPATNIGPTVGRATPDTVPPHSVMDVTFDVPSATFKASTGDTWAIWVNPDPHGGPLILATDIPVNTDGKLPITITVHRDGQTSWEQR